MKLYLLVTIKSRNVSFFAFSLLFASHLYDPLLCIPTLLRDKTAFSFPVTICVLSLYQVTSAGGLPFVPLHSHLKLSPSCTVLISEQLTVIIGVTGME